MDSMLPPSEQKITKSFSFEPTIKKILLPVLLISIILGGLTGYFLSNRSATPTTKAPTTEQAKVPQQDTRTFRDFAEGIIRKRSESKSPDEYIEGTHLLEREGAMPVALTSSVVDLSKYEDKKVKIFGETQKAIKEGWLMDVGRVEEIQ